MPEGYKYDVFISYLRTYPNGQKAPTDSWVREYLYPEIEQWLPDYMPLGYTTQVFFDDVNVRVGTDWPLALQQALQTSRCLLAVLSRQYLASEWCKAELETMLERERLLGLKAQANPSGLIYPVIFSGKEDSFPDAIRRIQKKQDLSEFAKTYSAFKESLEYGSFQMAVKAICEEMGAMIQSAPAWDKNWPVVVPMYPLRPTVLRSKM